VNPELREEVKRKVEERRPSHAKKAEAVLIPERPVEHRGMRGWGESVPEEPTIDVDNDNVPPPVDQETVEKIAAVQEPEPPKPSLELRIFGVAGRAAVADSGREASNAGYDTDDEDRALEDAIWAEAPLAASQKDNELPVNVNASEVGQSAKPTVNANREKLLARLEKEKMQATTENSTAEHDTHSTIDQRSTPQAKADSSSIEAEAKVRARLQLKLRLEREKAAAQAKAKEPAVDITDGPIDRAAVLRAKLLEKKMAASHSA
jgi:hypothetical protein